MVPALTVCKSIPTPTPFALQKAEEWRQRPTRAESVMIDVLPEEWGLSHSVAFGRYIADFLSPKLGLCVEVDGDSHRKRRGYDAVRDRFFRASGFEVVRVPNKVAIYRPWEALSLINPVVQKLKAKNARPKRRKLTKAQKREHEEWLKQYLKDVPF